MHSFQVSLVSKELSNHQEDVGKERKKQATSKKVCGFSLNVFAIIWGFFGHVQGRGAGCFHRLQASSWEIVLSELIKNIREVI